jgi:hypothetical protein
MSSWKRGWTADGNTKHTAPRFSVPLSGLNSSKEPKVLTQSENYVLTTGGRFRNTWLSNHIVKQRNPGPGRYRTDTDFPISKSDDVNVGKITNEKITKFLSFQKYENDRCATRTKMSTLKPSNLVIPITGDNTGDDKTLQFTVGPGAYNQYTYFGAPSGPSRKPYF